MEMFIIIISSNMKFFKEKKYLFFYLCENLATHIENLLTSYKNDQFNALQNPCLIVSFSKVPSVHKNDL